MSKCNEIIEKMYNHPSVNKLLSNIHPIELQEDLKQEMAMVLLNYDCDKLLKINKEGNIIGFTLMIIWKMGTLQRSEFNKVFKKHQDFEKAYQWMKSIEADRLDMGIVKYAKRILEDKLLIDPNEAHESMIFQKYIELRSCQKVADYFGIPRLHAFKIVKKTRQELKDKIKKMK